MKTCPHCNQVFADDLLYCLDDGTPLITATRPIGYGVTQSSSDMPTQVIPRAPVTQAQEAGNSSNFLFLIIGVLATALVGAGIYFVATRNSDGPASTANTAAPQKVSSPAAAIPPQPPKSPVAAPNKPTSTDSGVMLDGTWSGDWNSATASFTAAISLTSNGSVVSGRIVWTLRRTGNPKKVDKVGLTATEFVKGTFDPETRMVKLRGTRKDDPNSLIILDSYNLSLSEDGQIMAGKTKNGTFELRR